MVDGNGSVQLRNHAWRKLAEGNHFGERGEAAAANGSLDAIAERYLPQLARGEQFEAEVNSEANGASRRYRLSGEALRDDEGRVLGGIVTIRALPAKKAAAG